MSLVLLGHILLQGNVMGLVEMHVIVVGVDIELCLCHKDLVPLPTPTSSPYSTYFEGLFWERDIILNAADYYILSQSVDETHREDPG